MNKQGGKPTITRTPTSQSHPRQLVIPTFLFFFFLLSSLRFGALDEFEYEKGSARRRPHIANELTTSRRELVIFIFGVHFNVAFYYSIPFFSSNIAMFFDQHMAKAYFAFIYFLNKKPKVSFLFPFDFGLL